MDERVARHLEQFTNDGDVYGLLIHSVGRVLSKVAVRGDDWLSLVDERKIAHIVDWLFVAIAENAPWLGNVDDDGRPKKLLKFGDIDGIVREADRAIRISNQKGSRAPLVDGEERVVATLSEGFTIIEMLTTTALDRESAMMQHCVGMGSYDRQLGGGKTAFYSLRDAFGKPHATLEIDLRMGACVQTRGKQNAVPVEKYMSFLKEAFIALRLQVFDVDFVIDRDSVIHRKCDLPPRLRVPGHLWLSDRFESGPLPSVLSVGLDLSLRGRADVQELPGVFIVGGSIYAAACGIRDWSKVSMVAGHLDLIESNAESLARSLAVDGDLTIGGTKIKTLPSDLGVSGDLDLTGTVVEKMPDSLFVAGTLTMGKCPVISLPSDMEVGSLNLVGSSIAALPSGLIVNGDLILSAPVIGGALKSISPGVVVKGKVKVVRGAPLHYHRKAESAAYNGKNCDELEFDELKALLDTDFNDLPNFDSPVFRQPSAIARRAAHG